MIKSIHVTLRTEGGVLSATWEAGKEKAKKNKTPVDPVKWFRKLVKNLTKEKA